MAASKGKAAIFHLMPGCLLWPTICRCSRWGARRQQVGLCGRSLGRFAELAQIPKPDIHPSVEQISGFTFCQRPDSTRRSPSLIQDATTLFSAVADISVLGAQRSNSDESLRSNA